ncbi:MAG: hypothetical protein C5B57_03810 [Blastocatellia bacterium]|nr:MAG: hypothetical protein C5B57_03810 [Blastocatellia bacterium]
MDKPRSWLRYVEAGDLEDASIHFDGLPVQSASGDKLGKVDGFIIDADSGCPYHVVVDSGGWFRSKHYLVPVGHIRLDTPRRVLLADLTRDRIERFPGFDKDNFEKLTDNDLEEIDSQTASVCCPTETARNAAGQSWADRWAHYRQPDWWQSNYYRPDRAGARGVTAGAERR